MITFKEFLKESQLTLEDIKNECRSFLEQSNGQLVFRGAYTYKNKNPIAIEIPNNHIIEIFKKDTRMDRRPLNTDETITDYLDELFYNDFKIKGRTQTVFVSGNEQIAQSYGDLYIVLPRGDFKFIWSPKIADATTYFDYGDSDVTYKYPLAKYQDTDLSAAISSGHEIMISCKDYYLIPSTDKTKKLIKGLLNDNI